MKLSFGRLARRAVAVASVALIITGCSAGQDTGGASGSGTFVYASNSDIITDFDPASYYSNEDIILDNVYETLTTFNPAKNKIESSLATTWSSTPDALTWTFDLRPGGEVPHGSHVGLGGGQGIDRAGREYRADRLVRHVALWHFATSSCAAR